MTKQDIKNKLLIAVKNSPYNNVIKSAAVFGSYVNGTPTERSDIDILVEFTDNAPIGFFEYARLQRNLSEQLGLKVDLVTPAALSKFIKQQVLQEAESVYQR